MWVRGPVWDGAWLLSGIPMGVVFVVLSHWYDPRWMMVVVWAIFQTAHSIAPLTGAWSHPGFRAYMVMKPWKFIGVPVLLVGGIGALGYATSFWFPFPAIHPATLAPLFHPENPLFWIAALAVAWDTYHFGRQHFGMMQLYGRKRDAVLVGGDVSVRHNVPVNFDARRREDCRDKTARMRSGEVLGRRDKKTWVYAYPLARVPKPYVYPENHDQSLRRDFVISPRTIDLVICCATAWLARGFPWVHAAANWLRWPILGWYPTRNAYLAVAIVGAAILLWREWGSRRPSMPRVILIATASIATGTVVFEWPVTVWGFTVWPAASALGTVLMAHWFQAIGLSAHVAGWNQWAYCSVLLAVGLAMYVVVFGGEISPALAISSVAVAITLEAARLGVSIWHFLQDRWNYRFSKPIVRTTIGASLFATPV